MKRRKIDLARNRGDLIDGGISPVNRVGTIPSRRLLCTCLLLLVAACGGDPAAPVRQPAHNEVPAPSATYVGSARCGVCHDAHYAAWQGSHHARAMQAASPATVLGAFPAQLGQSRFFLEDGAYRVSTWDANGKPATFTISHTFGVYPLQQYLVDFPGGRLQALGIAWDARAEGDGGQRWFELYPAGREVAGDVLHWTGRAFTWNSMCADCHSTAVRKGYDPAAATYHTTSAEMGVGCEACHGPGSAHAASPSANSLPVAVAARVETCAPCHARRSQVAEGFAPGKALLDHYVPALLTPPLYYPDGQIHDEVFEYGSFASSRMASMGVICTDCHEPHTAKLRAEGDALCELCHSPAGNPRFPSLPKKRYASAAHHAHAESSEGARCVNCHMPQTTYMAVHPRRDHSLRIPRPRPDATSPSACTRCHQTRDEAWAQAALAKGSPPTDPAHWSVKLDGGRPDTLRQLWQDASAPAIVRASALARSTTPPSGQTLAAAAERLSAIDPLIRLALVTASERSPTAGASLLLEKLSADPLLGIRAAAAFARARRAPPDAPLHGGSTLAELRAVQHVNADTPEALVNLATLDLLAGDVTTARSQLNKALTIAPDFVPALINLADLDRQTGRDVQAGPLLQRAIVLAPDLADVHYAYALWQIRRRDIKQAITSLAKAHALAPQNSTVLHAYVTALLETGAVPLAEQTLAAAEVTVLGEERLLVLGVRVAETAEDSQRTLHYLKKLVELVPDDPRYQSALRARATASSAP
ncbi:MAG: hypothetical protein H6993_08960 [Pseudomonadales bacterium]|nr:hypothetical protein [Pseudomonadales bacterium]